MLRATFIFGASLILLLADGHALDLPVDLNFRLGFKIHVIPGPGDMSRALNLLVVPEHIYSDKVRILTVTGYITNYGDVPCEGVAMRFDVTSYVKAGTATRGALVEPNTIPPGGSARFTVHVSLDRAKPKFAMYTVTARSPLVRPTEPEIVLEPMPPPGESVVLPEVPAAPEESPAE